MKFKWIELLIEHFSPPQWLINLFYRTFFGSLMGHTLLLMGLISAYLLAWVFVYYNIRAPLLAMQETLGIFWFATALVVPPACILLFVMLPLALRATRRRRLRAMAIAGVPKPGYFRLHPYRESDHRAFRRLDNADREVLNWLKSTSSSLLFLSGASGVGKSSLLSAAVLPALSAAGWTVVQTRAFNNPVKHLRKALVDTKGLLRRVPADETSPLLAILQAAARANVRRRLGPLLLVIDQLEEFLIPGDEASRTEFALLLAEIARTPSDELRLLLVFRSDYRRLLFTLELPPLLYGGNWHELAPYDRNSAVSMLRGGGFELSKDVLDALFSGLDRIEDAPGLYRPIMLNMIGVALQRMGGVLRGAPSQLIHTYLTDSLTTCTSRDYVKPVLLGMITESGTKQPRTEAELADETHLDNSLVKFVLNDLEKNGLVRRLEGTETTWEVAHDFVARMIGPLVGKLKPTLMERGRPLVVSIVLLFALAMPYWSLLQQQVAEKSLRDNFGATISAAKPKGISVSLRQLDDLKLARAVRFLVQLDGLTLSLSNATITSLEPLKGLTNLSVLNLNGATSINSLEPLRSLTNLSALNLSDATGITSIEPIKGLTNLSTLNLSNAPGITSIEPIKDLTNLSALNLSNDAGITSIEPIKGLTNLSALNISNATGITSIEPLRGLTNLSLLNLSNANGITTTEPVDHLPNLRALYPVNSCGQLVGTWLWSIGDTAVFYEDGNARHGASTAKWVCDNGTFVATWTDGFVDRIAVSRNGENLSVVNSRGNTFTASRR